MRRAGSLASRRAFWRRSLTSHVVRCALLPVVTGCGQAPPETVEAAREAVIYGQPSGPEDDGVVQLWANEGTVIDKCTGTLIAGNLVLTARHCVAHYNDGAFACTSNGELTPGSMGGQIGAPLEPSTITVRTGASPGAAVATATQIFAAQATSVCRNDIAVILLDRALSGLPIMALRLNAGVEPGETVRLVGYGVDENNGFGQRKVRSPLTVGIVGLSQFRPKGDDVAARTFVIDGPAGCYGDSGGPTFSDRNAVVGVFSQIVGLCTASTAREYFTEVAPFYDELLKPAFAAAQATPIVEMGGAMGGAAGDAGAFATDMAGAAGATAAGGAAAIPDAGVGTAGAPSELTDSGPDAADASDYHLPRKPGGCRCRFGAASSAHDPQPLLAAFAVLVWHARGRRRRRRARG